MKNKEQQVDEEYHRSHPKAKLVRVDDTSYDVYLYLVEGKSDKYYVIQLLQTSKNKFVCFTRWGRTGSHGTYQTTLPISTLDKAKSVFEKKFREKTGNSFEDYLTGTYRYKFGYYNCLPTSISVSVSKALANGVNWEFLVNGDVVGKRNGWYSYERNNASEVENLYQTYKLQQIQRQLHNQNLSLRTITSDLNGFSYQIDLINLRQINMETMKQREIRRVNPNGYELSFVQDMKQVLPPQQRRKSQKRNFSMAFNQPPKTSRYGRKIEKPILFE